MRISFGVAKSEIRSGPTTSRADGATPRATGQRQRTSLVAWLSASHTASL